MTAGLEARLRKGTDCELRFDALTRQLYATDASLYQIEPLGVAFPRSAEQAAGVIRTAADLGVAIIPRGAGTGLVGGAIGRGLVVDFSRYNRGITAFDPQRRTVRVGPGVVLDQLNAFLRPHGLQFGPDVATSSRASLGGMIANNSSGAHVPVYGVTADHVIGLDLVLADGSLVRLGEAGDWELETGDLSRIGFLPNPPSPTPHPQPPIREPVSLVALANGVSRLVELYGEEIRRRLPEGLFKRWPGYAFDRYLRRPGDLTQLIAGSEGTLAAIVSAELRVIPLPARRTLGVLFFDSVADAMQATVELLDLKPAAIEHIDRQLFDQTRGQLQFRAARDLLRLDERPCESILLVEFFDDCADRLAALASRRIGVRRLMLDDEGQQALVWAMRKAGLTLLTSRKGPAKPVTCIEDVAVRPEQLPAYVAGLQSILGRLRLEASFYGHAVAGLLHVRPVLDLHTPEGVALLRQVADEVSALTLEFRGSLAGEHGVGIARTEYLSDHLGPELMAASRELKALFDPRGVMNPGKIVPVGTACRAVPGARPAGGTYYCIDTNLRQDPDRRIELPFASTLGFVERDGSFIANLEQCNGNGACLKNAATMCPTYIVTHEEIMSTRGRANTIRAALDGRLGPREQALLSDELDAALQPCLSCKACKTECPSNVDLALLKAELLHARQRHHGPSLFDRMLASADALGRIGSMAAPMANSLLKSPTARWLMEFTLGIDRRRTLPLYAERRLASLLDRELKAAERDPRAEAVVLWDDTWVRYHEPHIALAAVSVLRRAGYQVLLPRGRECCGRPAFSRGMLDEAAAMGRHNIALLEGRYPDLPVVFLEPSCLSMFIDDYLQLGLPGARELARRCIMFEAFVDQAGEARRLQLRPLMHAKNDRFSGEGPVHLAIHAHCHAKALLDVQVLARLARRVPEAQVTLLDTACCGMAGAYGMLKSNYELSLQVAQPMVERMRALPEGSKIIASGTSCRHQIHDLAGASAYHMAEILALAGA